MYNFNNNMLPEDRKAWRNASEIQVAALEHEKRRYQIMNEETTLAKPQVLARRGRRAGWAMLINASLRLISILSR